MAPWAGEVVGIQRPQQGIHRHSPIEALHEVVEERLAAQRLVDVHDGGLAPGPDLAHRRTFGTPMSDRPSGPSTALRSWFARTSCSLTRFHAAVAAKPVAKEPAPGTGVGMEVVGDVPHVVVDVVTVEHPVGDGG